MNPLLTRVAIGIAILVFAAGIYALLSQGRDERLAALQDDSAPNHAAVANAGLTVERTWSGAEGELAYAAVVWENHSTVTLGMRLSVQCVAEDTLGDMVAENGATLVVRDVGPMRPGSRHELIVEVPLRGAAYDSIACRVTDAR
jgi:hypothetical protein